MNWDEKHLSEWFEELNDATVQSRVSIPESGGNYVVLIWKTSGGEFYKTTHSDWNVKCRHSTIQPVKMTIKTVTTYEANGEVKRKEK